MQKEEGSIVLGKSVYDYYPSGLSWRQVTIKRSFDLLVSFLSLTLVWWVILIAWIISTLDTRRNGFFTQERIGLNGRRFRVIKIRTMIPNGACTTTTTSAIDPRITRLGRLMRKAKIDELPQLWNILVGDMSFVGPRPDVPGFADMLVGDERIVLSVRPGITGPATLQYKYEEELLSTVADPDKFNREVIYPHKVKINIEYIKNYSLLNDIKCIVKTVLG